MRRGRLYTFKASVQWVKNIDSYAILYKVSRNEIITAAIYNLFNNGGYIRDDIKDDIYPKTFVVSFRLDEKLMQFIEYAAKKLLISKSKLIRLAINQFLEYNNIPQPVVTYGPRLR